MYMIYTYHNAEFWIMKCVQEYILPWQILLALKVQGWEQMDILELVIDHLWNWYRWSVVSLRLYQFGTVRT